MAEQELGDWTPIVGAFPSGRGSEDGYVRLDEEHPLGARVTLEDGGTTAPWSITCGLYGSMVHTAFCASEAEARAKLAAMKDRLIELALIAPGDDRYDGFRRFVDDF